jgi:Tol biopolymer transport system component
MIFAFCLNNSKAQLKNQTCWDSDILDNRRILFMNTTHKHRMQFSIIGLLLASMLIIACDGSVGDDVGEDNGRQQRFSIFPPTVFLADKDVNAIDELFAAFSDGSEIIKLSDPLVAKGDVVAFRISPDGIFVAYVADQDTAGLFELYVVPVDKTPSETAVKVSGAMAGNGILQLPSGEYVFRWAPDSSRIAYVADQNMLRVFELFTSTPDGIENDIVSNLPDPDQSTNPDPDVENFEWEPNSTLIAYIADQDTDEVFELYVSPSDSNTPNVKVSGTELDGNGIKELEPVPSGEFAFAWAPDSSRLAFLADQLIDAIDEFELYTNLPDGTNNLRVSGLQGNSSQVDNFAWAPNSRQIAYRANQNLITAIDLFTALPNVSSSFQQISSGLEPGQEVTAFKWSPDSTRLAFISDRAFTGFFRLFTTSPNNSNNVLVSGSLVSTTDVTVFKWSPDSLRIAYVDMLLGGVFELFTTLRDVEPSTLISSSLADDDEEDFAWAPNSSRIAYIADPNILDEFELFSSTRDGDAINIVSGPLVIGGDVQEFKWAPDNSGIGYIADQDTDTVDELFASQPNGGSNTLLSGTLVSGGDVLSFDWVP